MRTTVRVRVGAGARHGPGPPGLRLDLTRTVAGVADALSQLVRELSLGRVERGPFRRDQRACALSAWAAMTPASMVSMLLTRS